MKVLVTGGGGFLGAAVVRQLVARGDDVRSLTRGSYPELATLGVSSFRGDLSDSGVVRAAVAGCDVVFHVGAKAGIAGSAREYTATNVDGTHNIIAACRASGVRRLVYTSTPSVVAVRGGIAGGDESLPYARRHQSAYPETKAEAEQAVLAANGAGLVTVALRPHLIWGPGDTQLVPRILERARRGRLRFVGDGDNLVDCTYIDNAVQAHLLAADRLRPGSRICGRAYFISQGEPLPIRELVNRILTAAGMQPVTATIPFPFAYALGGLCEAVFGLVGRGAEPPMTRFLARQLATTHWFDISAARRDLGYQPVVSISDGLARLGEHLRRQ
ncbi:MAG: NAD-dependent epimerase/dehydratase family protein [Geodermatophilaceae bacterium]|nr:NAD-dependent epimerase/dehydratase family protein [Geodermatophilaceae bacterium]MDQ3466537.1 NAD-dependent epimerase/dehydratase family protein [Actinomycetota bacterium]